MIYNLANNLITYFNTYEFVINGFQPNSPNECILISDTGGSPGHYYDRTDYRIQFLIRSLDVVTGKKVADEIYAYVKNKFHWVLPAVTVGGKTYPEVKVAQISPIQSPGSIGPDEEGRWLFSFNSYVVV